MHVSGLLISLLDTTNSPFVRDICVTLKGKWPHAGYVKKAETHKKIPFDTTSRSKHVRVVQ